jgi:aspartyl-tRNA(Asn)/glutamyl-tRNA(Gln) amidotransferase subunit C
MAPKASHIDVRYVAGLARLALTDAEVRRFETELADILGYVGQLSELDVTGIEPTAHAAPRANVLRDDVPCACLDRARVLANAPAADDECVRVPPVIEEEP